MMFLSKIKNIIIVNSNYSNLKIISKNKLKNNYKVMGYFSVDVTENSTPYINHKLDPNKPQSSEKDRNEM